MFGSYIAGARTLWSLAAGSSVHRTAAASGSERRLGDAMKKTSSGGFCTYLPILVKAKAAVLPSASTLTWSTVHMMCVFPLKSFCRSTHVFGYGTRWRSFDQLPPASSLYRM